MDVTEGTHVGNVVAGHEDLGDGLFEGSEELVPQSDEAPLSDSGEGLLLSHRPLLASYERGEFHAVQSHPNRAGRDDHNAVAERAEGETCFGEGGEGGKLGEVRRLWVQDRRRS